MSNNHITISLIQIDTNLTKIFSSYCQLLKSKLKYHWIVNNKNDDSQVIVVNQGYIGSISKEVKVKIILCKEYKKLNSSHKCNSFDLFMFIPVNSSKTS